jgi:hypothetical protein
MAESVVQGALSTQETLVTEPTQSIQPSELVQSEEVPQPVAITEAYVGMAIYASVSAILTPKGLDSPVNPEVPVKRKPGRPKGSGKKPVPEDDPPKIKRPVGRPRKDGLPAGSVNAPRRPPGRPRKRPPGQFASGMTVIRPASTSHAPIVVRATAHLKHTFL